MSEPCPDELVDAVDLYVDVQQVLLNRLAAGADPGRVVVAMQAHEFLQTRSELAQRRPKYHRLLAARRSATDRAVQARRHRACGGATRLDAGAVLRQPPGGV
jgi:hypothetical protein